MKLSFSVLSALRNLINVEAVTDEINGKIHKVSAPTTEDNEDIVINTLTMDGEYLQQGFANLNIYVKDVAAGLANTKRLEELTSIVIPLVDDKKAPAHDITVQVNGEEQSLFSNKSYVFFQIASPGVILKDQERENTHFINIKLKFQTL